MGKRRRGRETALKLLYAIDLTQQPADEILHASWIDTVVPEIVREFSMMLVAGVMTHRDEIDALVQDSSMHWSLERIGVIERNILRFAIYELLFLPDVPSNVTINEAVEVAKRYGTDEAPSFINGILDRIKQEIEVRDGEQPTALSELLHSPSI